MTTGLRLAIQALLTILSFVHLIIFCLQRDSQQPANLHFIVDDERNRFHSRGRLAWQSHRFANVTKEQVMERPDHSDHVAWQRKRKPHGLAEGAEQDRKQRAHAAALREHRANIQQDDLTLTPAGKFTDAMASDIYKALKVQSESPLVVEGTQFETKARVMEAIHDLASQLQFALKKQQHRKRRKQ